MPVITRPFLPKTLYILEEFFFSIMLKKSQNIRSENIKARLYIRLDFSVFKIRFISYLLSKLCL